MLVFVNFCGDIRVEFEVLDLLFIFHITWLDYFETLEHNVRPSKEWIINIEHWNTAIKFWSTRFCTFCKSVVDFIPSSRFYLDYFKKVLEF